MKELDLKQLFDQDPALISADQRLGADRGMLPIKEVRRGDRCAFGRIEEVRSFGEMACIHVLTRMGRRLTCAPASPVPVEGGGWVRAEEAKGRRLKLQVPMLAARRHVVRWCPVPSMVSSIEIDEDWGRLLGYFMGDGSMNDSTLSIACNGLDQDVVVDVCGLIQRLLGLATTRTTGSKGGCTEVRHWGERTVDLFDRLDVLRRDSSGKLRRDIKVPDCIWRSPKTVAREFLRGLFEADGCAYKAWSKVVLFSKDIEFLRDVHLLLLAFGVVGQIDSRPARNGVGYVYQANTLTLWAEAAKIFGREIGFVSQRRRDVVESGAISRGGRKPRPMEWFDEVIAVAPAGVCEVVDVSVQGSTRYDAGGVIVNSCTAS